MEIGVFIPIGNNGWLISSTSPQYTPSFDLNREVVLRAERYGFDFALSMIKLPASAASRVTGTTISSPSP
jgi:pyrimidine oxygenase